MPRVLRVRHRTLQTPVITYSHRETGRTMTLIGMSHIGEAGYYQRLHDLACGLEAAGAVVHYEGVNSPSKEDWEAATTEDQRVAFRAVMQKRQAEIRALCRYLGWESQTDAMPYPATWHNVDIGGLEYLNSAGLQNYIDEGQDGDRKLAILGDQRDLIFGASTSALLRLMSLDRLHLLSRWMSRDPVGDVRLNQRNRHALENLPTDRGAVLLWGADHLTGLAAGLRQAGYRVRSATWIDAGKLPGVWASARTVWSAVRTLHADAPESQDAPREGVRP